MGKTVELNEKSKICPNVAGTLHMPTEGLASELTLNFAPVEDKPIMMIKFGLDPKTELVTIYGGPDGEKVVVWHRDGTVTIPDPSRIDEAAHTFVEAVRRIIEQNDLRNAYVVREVGVDLYLSYSVGEEQWVDRIELATHFVRREDAFGFAAGWNNREIVPASQARI
jgi:hypothetical protein